MSDAVERLTESNFTSYAAALDFAFTAFREVLITMKCQLHKFQLEVCCIAIIDENSTLPYKQEPISKGFVSGSSVLLIKKVKLLIFGVANYLQFINYVNLF